MTLLPCYKQFLHKNRTPPDFQRIQYLWQLTQIPFIDVSTNAPIGVFYVGSHKMKSICCCQEREEFVLLGLIIQDLGFWFPRAKHLRVSMPVAGELLQKSYSTLRSFTTWIAKSTSVSSRNMQDHTTVWQGEGSLAVKNGRLLIFQH